MTVIGYMVDKSSGTNLVSHDAKDFPLAAQGWTAYDKNK